MVTKRQLLTYVIGRVGFDHFVVQLIVEDLHPDYVASAVCTKGERVGKEKERKSAVRNMQSNFDNYFLRRKLVY